MLIEHTQIACLILPKLIFCVGLLVIIWDAFLIFSYIHQGATDRLLRHCHVICLFFYLVTFKWNVNCLYILDFCVFTPAALSAVRQFKNVKKKDTNSRRSWRSHVSRPQQWRQVSWLWNTEEEDQILRSADLHFARFSRILLQFFAALRGSSCPKWRVSHRGSSSCSRPRRERPRRWPKPANVSRRLGLRANICRACEQVEADGMKWWSALISEQ